MLKPICSTYTEFQKFDLFSIFSHSNLFDFGPEIFQTLQVRTFQLPLYRLSFSDFSNSNFLSDPLRLMLSDLSSSNFQLSGFSNWNFNCPGFLSDFSNSNYISFVRFFCCSFQVRTFQWSIDRVVVGLFKFEFIICRWVVCFVGLFKFELSIAS